MRTDSHSIANEALFRFFFKIVAGIERGKRGAWEVGEGKREGKGGSTSDMRDVACCEPCIRRGESEALSRVEVLGSRSRLAKLRRIGHRRACGGV